MTRVSRAVPRRLSRRWARALAAVVFFAATVGACGPRTRDPSSAGAPLRVFAAASLAPVLTDLEEDFEIALGFPLEYNFAASSALARQVDAGAPADVVVSANPAWADWLAERGRIADGTRREGPGNSLVVVAPLGAAFVWSAASDRSLADAFPGRLALADPSHVPAGIYAREALVHAGAWGALESRVVGALDSRAALALVERGECGAGIVYRSDALASQRVEVVGPIPAGWHEPVRYVMGAVAGADTARARAWLDAMDARPTARRLAEHGFRVATERAL